MRIALPLAVLWVPACIGLAPVPTGGKQDDAARDRDSGIPLDSGDPIDSAGDDNRAPVADAGDDDAVSVGTLLVLDGGASYDPDGDTLQYAWRFVTRPSASSATLDDDTRVDPELVPDVPGRYELGLVVSDGALDSDEDTVAFTVTAENGGPVANAGRDQLLAVGDTAYLDGSDSSIPDGDALQFAWSLVRRPSGSAATLTASTSPTPRFVADIAGTYEVSLTVTDGADVSPPDTVLVTAEADTGDTTDTTGCGCHATRPGDALGAALLVAAGGLLNRRRARRT